MPTRLETLLRRIPAGYTKGQYRDATWGISHTLHNHGKSGKIFGEELGGKDFISCNYYFGTEQTYLKPCEMPEPKVLDFLEQVELEQPTTPEE